jgi:hypothetical protein
VLTRLVSCSNLSVVNCLDQDEQAKIETLHKKRNLLAAYCKLIVHNVLPIQAATNILKYYVKVSDCPMFCSFAFQLCLQFSNDFGDIIKNTFTRARDISKIHTAKNMAYSLMAVRPLQRCCPQINTHSLLRLGLQGLRCCPRSGSTSCWKRRNNHHRSVTLTRKNERPPPRCFLQSLASLDV